MRIVASCIVVAAIAGPASAEPRTELEVDIGNSPAGVFGLRAIRRVGPHDTGIGLGAGIGLTGAIASIGVDQPVHRRRVHAKVGFDFDQQTSLYVSYALGSLESWNREPFGPGADLMRDGAYHWIDVGVALRMQGKRLYLAGGIGVTILVAHPDPIGRMDVEDEDLLWWIAPEGWARQQGWGPALWSAIGYRL